MTHVIETYTLTFRIKEKDIYFKERCINDLKTVFILRRVFEFLKTPLLEYLQKK